MLMISCIFSTGLLSRPISCCNLALPVELENAIKSNRNNYVDIISVYRHRKNTRRVSLQTFSILIITKITQRLSSQKIFSVAHHKICSALIITKKYSALACTSTFQFCHPWQISRQFLHFHHLLIVPIKFWLYLRSRQVTTHVPDLDQCKFMKQPHFVTSIFVAQIGWQIATKIQACQRCVQLTTHRCNTCVGSHYYRKIATRNILHVKKCALQEKPVKFHRNNMKTYKIFETNTNKIECLET